MLFIAGSIGKKSLAEHIKLVRDGNTPVKQIVMITESFESRHKVNVTTYSEFKLQDETASPCAAAARQEIEYLVQPDDVLNLQFTSGECSFLSSFDHPSLFLLGYRNYWISKSSHAYT